MIVKYLNVNANRIEMECISISIQISIGENKEIQKTLLDVQSKQIKLKQQEGK